MGYTDKLLTMHPNHYTLSLLKHLLDKADHTLFPAKRLEEMKKEYERMSQDPSADQPRIESVISRFGREIWPYQEALEELYKRHGKAREEKMVREKLDLALREKYDRFLSAGGDLADFRRGAEVEVYFTPEEKFQIGQAVVDTSYAVLREIAKSCALDLKGECEEVIQDHQEKLARITKKLEALRALAERSEKWRLEIEDKIRAFEQSFGYLTKTFHETDIDGAIDYYQGVIDSPEFG